jgi:hypothetical protein
MLAYPPLDKALMIASTLAPIYEPFLIHSRLTDITCSCSTHSYEHASMSPKRRAAHAKARERPPKFFDGRHSTCRSKRAHRSIGYTVLGRIFLRRNAVDSSSGAGTTPAQRALIFCMAMRPYTFRATSRQEVATAENQLTADGTITDRECEKNLDKQRHGLDG